MTRKLRLLVAAIATLALAVPAAPAQAQSRNKCRTSSTTGGAKIIKRTSAVVMFTKRLSYYGCAYSGGPIRRLLDEGGGIHVRGDAAPQISGRYVAYATLGSAIGDEFDRVVVWDLKLGHLAFRAPSNSVVKLAVKANGSVAWTQGSVVAEPNGTPQVYEVHAASMVDREGDLLLDRGADIDPRSLALTPERESIRWTRGGATRTAPLR
jgi:hypothetical protein